MAAETAGGGASTRQLWAAIAPIYDAILAHPFIRSLADGTLARDSFREQWPV